MTTLRFTLVAEGTSDRVLIPILRWMLLRHHSGFEWMGQLAELHELANPPRTLSQKIVIASHLFPADVIFIHRDADRASPLERRQEIASAMQALPEPSALCWLPVVPVRMTEAWLLVSETALRGASGNPNGRNPLRLPLMRDLETIPDPKEVLRDLLVEASGLSGRRRKQMNFPALRARVPDFLDSWEHLLRLPSAKQLNSEIERLAFE